MADKYQDTSTVDTQVYSKPALITDLNAGYLGKDQYIYARNAVRNSKEGDLGTISNEPSTIACLTTPYKQIGAISLPDSTLLLFSTDDKHSEIGLGDPNTCIYSTLSNSSCWGFSTDSIITGEAKHDFQKGIVVTFTDKRQPIRRIELQKLKNLTDCASFDEILLSKKISQPCITAKKGQVGNMPNGTYSVLIAYVVNGQIFSDWYSITDRIQLFSELGSNSIEVKISGLDTEFKEFALAVIGNYIDPVTKGATKLAKIIGNFSTKIKSVTISDFLNTNYQEIKISNFLTQKRTWVTAGILASNANTLFAADLVGRKEENYQLKAMGIKAEYVVEQVPVEYYEQDGQDVSMYRDENYDFYIHGIYNTGETTDKFHIPGNKATAFDLDTVSSADVYEYDTQFSDCEAIAKIPRWKTENTAGKMVGESNKFVCDRRIIGHGKFGYFESTDLYADNKAMFGTDAGQPIRYHKTPDEKKVPRYEVIGTKTYINIIGVRFKNIPKFESPDIIGYKITRSDRKGGNGTVIARGIITNVRSYMDKQIDQLVMYSNYTVNDLGPDQYLSSTQTSFKRHSEQNFTPLSTYHKDRFTFYSPHTSFEPRYSLGSELKIESEEVAEITGQFEKVYKHPQEKLMNQFAFWLAAAVGIIEAGLVILGTTDYTARTGTIAAPPLADGTYGDTANRLEIKTVADLISMPISKVIDITTKAVKAFDFGSIGTILNLVKAVIETVAALGLKGAYSIAQGLATADQMIQTIQGFTGYTDYVYQYNAVAKFNQSLPVDEGNKRRRLLKPATYIPSTVVSLQDDKIFHNLFREKSVYLELNKEIANPRTQDTSRNTIAGFGLCDNPLSKVKSTGSAFYATSKTPNPNQYGQLGSSSPVSMHSCVFKFADTEFSSTPVIYGGDCIIARFQFQKRMKFFNQDLGNTQFPPGTEFDYRLYRNIAYPRYWMDSTKYDFSDLLSNHVINYTQFSRTTTGKYNLDCPGKDKKSPTRIDDAYMYLSNNCALDFIVESDYNPEYREKTDHPYYSKHNTDIKSIFRSDHLEFPEEFKISRVYSDIYTTELYLQQQREDFDPLNPIPVLQPNSVVYSLPSFNLQNVDNWQYFLPANFFSFRESDFGVLTGIHKLDQDRLIFLFSKSSPYISMGRDILELKSGREVTIGDGGLFAQDPREIMPTDNNYGACNSRYAFSNTHLGRFYPSERQGRILNFTESLDDISRQGVSYWCKNYMPIFLYKYFPTYPQVENPVSGVGYLTAFDSFNETVYICKRDFSPKREYINDISYTLAGFTYKGESIKLRDPQYFNDISWTLSYSPGDKGFISWHDWHPDWVIQTDNHFMTVKDNIIYKHNEAFDSFCNFYGKDYPFELGSISSTGQQVHIVRSIEYFLEVYKYKNFGRDRFHVLNENFDGLIVKNTEQISPWLSLVLSPSDPEARLEYPKKGTQNALSFDILYTKVENKYRVNQFWDSVKDRGEFSHAENHLFPVDESGYKGIINPVAVDINKPEEERKKFRHYWTEFRLIKTKSGDKKFITKLMNIKKLISPR